MSKKVLITELIWLTAIFKVFGQPPYGSGKPVNCTVINLKADCSYRGPVNNRKLVSELKLPADKHRGKMTALDISNNQFINITFDKFPQVKVILMRNVDFYNRTQYPKENWFLKLKALEELDMSETGFSSKELRIIWPPGLSKLILSNMKNKLTQVYGLEKLNSLEELDLSDNNLNVLPKLNVSAPIKVINLNENPITDLTVEEIAPYCELHSFAITIKSDPMYRDNGEYVLSHAKKYNACHEVNEWFTQYFPKMHTGLTCHGSRGSKHVDFSERAIKLRNDCLTKLPSTTVLDLLLYAVFFAVLFPILYFCNEAYNKYQSGKSAAPARNVKVKARHHKRRTTTKSPSEVTAEASHSEKEYDLDADPYSNAGSVREHEENEMVSNPRNSKMWKWE